MSNEPINFLLYFFFLSMSDMACLIVNSLSCLTYVIISWMLMKRNGIGKTLCIWFCVASILNFFLCKSFGFLNVFVASQSEITWRLDKSSSCDKDESKSEGKGLLSRSEITHGEHPLSLGKTSIWNQFFQVSYQVNSLNMGQKSHFWNLIIFYAIHTKLVWQFANNFFIVPYLRKLTILVPFGCTC